MTAPITTVDELLAAARAHGLELVAEGATLDTMGLDFLAVHARDASGTRWIVRSPRRADLIPRMRHEARVLAVVKDALGVAVPDWRIHTDDVIAYPRLDGIPAVTLDSGAPVWNRVDPAAPHDGFLDDFAQLFTRMQTIDAASQGVRARTIDEERARIRHAVESTRDVLQPPDALWDRWQRWLAAADSWPDTVSLVHADLHPGHMLLDEAGRLCGVLDWTEAEISDPTIDLAMFGGCFGRPALESVVQRMTALGARALGPHTVDHAMERWAVGPALGARWALDHDSSFALDHARGMIAQLA